MLSKKDLQEIVRECRKELKKNPNDEKNLRKIGAAYYNLGEYKRAVSYYTHYLTKVNKENYSIWNKLGLTYRDMKKNKEAIEAFKKSLSFKQDFDKAWANLARINYDEKNYDQAIQQYKHACDINSNNKDYWYELAQGQLQKKLYSGAIRSFKNAILVDRNFDVAWDNLAATYKKLGEKEKMKLAMSQNWEILEERYFSSDEKAKMSDLEKKLLKTEKLIEKEQYSKAKPELESIFKEAELYIFKEILEEANSQLDLCKNKIDEEKRAKEAKIMEEQLEVDLSKVGKLIKKEQYTKAKTMLYAILQKATEYNLDVISAQANREFDIVEKLEFEQRFETTGDLEKDQFNKNEIEVLRGGDWKVEGDQSVFYYKPKIINNSKFVITNIQILLTQVPSCLEVMDDLYKIDSLRPRSFEAPTFKLKALESCVGDTIGAIITYTNPSGNQETIEIQPFEIEYVCNLLVPRQISRKDFEKKVKNMNAKELVIDCGLDIDEAQNALSSILLQNNFFLLEQLKQAQDTSHRTLEGFAQGRYDKEDVALSLTMEKQEDNTQVIIKGMSDRVEKLTDLLRDINVKCDSIKSDTILIKQYTEQISDIMDGIQDLESYLRKRIGSDVDKIKIALDDYRNGKIKKVTLIARCIGVLGKRFIKAFPIVGKVMDAIPA
ncbi:MAG: tetratricopeptide repeat protein [Candidatus Hodarchaeota archaeon]